MSRRGFLTRTAVVGAALVVAPWKYVTRPTTAYAAVCACKGACACGTSCCDGYTEFCCTLYGANTCPPGTVAAGWWKADGSGFCDVAGEGRPRYYFDCNYLCGDCGCSASGFCSGSCTGAACGCGAGDCDNRKADCTLFRYGQCHQELPCVGVIACRVITCEAPWEFDETCTTASATDNSTRFHHGLCLEPDTSTPALPRGIPVIGDWNGDGVPTIGVFDDGVWYLRNSSTVGPATIVFGFGDPGDTPIVGDWNGDGVDTVGVVRNGTWYLRNSNSTGPPDRVFSYGDRRDIPVVGDWDGDGVDSPGVFRRGWWYLRNSNSTGVADFSFAYGNPSDRPVVGDWNGDGVDTPGVIRGAMWHLRDSNSTGAANRTFLYGDPGDRFIVGDWDGDGVDSPGLRRGVTWYLRNENSTGPADAVF